MSTETFDDDMDKAPEASTGWKKPDIHILQDRAARQAARLMAHFGVDTEDDEWTDEVHTKGVIDKASRRRGAATRWYTNAADRRGGGKKYEPRQ